MICTDCQQRDVCDLAGKDDPLLTGCDASHGTWAFDRLRLDRMTADRDALRAELDAAHDGEDALRSEVAKLRAQIEALQSVPQGVEVEVPRWEDVDAKFQAGEPRNPLDDFVHSNEPAIDDEDGTCADEVFRAELKAAIDWVTARLVPTTIKPLQPEERRVGPDEVVVPRSAAEYAILAFDWIECPDSEHYEASRAFHDALRTSAQDHNGEELT